MKALNGRNYCQEKLSTSVDIMWIIIVVLFLFLAYLILNT